MANAADSVAGDELKDSRKNNYNASIVPPSTMLWGKLPRYHQGKLI